MKKKLSLLTLLTLIATNTAQAEYGEGFYAGALGGANWVHYNKHNHTEVEFKTGYAAGGFVGYRWCEGLRLEGEITYRHNGVDKVKASDISIKHKGHLTSWSYMANILYDMDIGSWDYCGCWDIVPYVGVGIGYEHQRLKAKHDSLDIDASLKEGGFAWQLIAGVVYPVYDTWDVGLQYCFNKGRSKYIYNHSLEAVVKVHY